ncbi:MAG TPA: alpha-E domain-containing protein [Bryobacteraceae bacterium]|nr:alpha-E domain-containing protein [Bryobacteraceae bacterium]
MLSRVADSLYWMSRYLERAEHTARVINVQLNLMLERGAGSDDEYWARVLRSLGVPMTAEEENHAQTLAVGLVRDTAHGASIVSSIIAARENARQVREQISSEMWEQLNRLFHSVRRAHSEAGAWDAREFLQSVKEGAHLFQGITDSTMTHGEGWQFIQAGRFLERTVSVSTLVGSFFRERLLAPRPAQSVKDEGEPEHLEWLGLLRSCTAFEAYCKAYTADLKPERIAEFLVLHAGFPHSIRFSAAALEGAVKEIGGEARSRGKTRLERIAGRLHATLSFGQIDEIMGAGLEAYLDTVLRQCGQVHSALYQTYIAYPIEAALGT